MTSAKLLWSGVWINQLIFLSKCVLQQRRAESEINMTIGTMHGAMGPGCKLGESQLANRQNFDGLCKLPLFLTTSRTTISHSLDTIDGQSEHSNIYYHEN